MAVPVVEARVAWRPEQFNRVTNPGFETNTTGWAVTAGINGAGTSITRITTDFRSGVASGSLVCPATALTGVNYDFGTKTFFAVATYMSVYRFVVWLKSVSGTTQARLIAGSLGTSADRAARDITLTTAWQPFYLDWAPSATRTDVEFAIVNIPAAAMTARIDDVAVFLRDAHTQVENGYFTADTGGWSVAAGINGAGTSIIRQTSGGYYGASDGRLVTTATSGSGVNWLFGSAKFTQGRTYRLRVWLKSVSGSTSARLRLGSIGTGADRGDSTVTITTSWAAYTVDWTPSADRTDASLAISNGSAAVATFDIDGVEVYEALDDISADAFGVNGAENLTYGRGASFDGSGQATGFANLRVVNALTAGKYSPENSSGPLYGLLEPGKPILIRAVYSGIPYGLFYGSVDRLVPMPLSLVCEILCTDPLDALARLSYHASETAGAIQSARTSALNYNKVYNTSLGSGPWEQSYAYRGTNERSLLEYLNDLNKATGTIHYAKPSVYASVGWQLVTIDRTVHSDASAVVEAWNDDLSDMAGYDVTREALVNRQRVAVNSYQSREQRWTEYLAYAKANDIDAVPDITPTIQVVQPGLSGTMPALVMPFTLPANETRILRYEFSAPVKGVLAFSSIVTVESTAVTLMYRGTAADSTVLLTPVRGVPLFQQPINDADRSDFDSISRYGEYQGGPISSPYIQHPAYADALGDWVIWRHSRPRARPTAQRHNLFASQLGRDVGDIVSLTFARLSISAKAFVALSFTTSVSQNARDWQTTYRVEELPTTPAGGWFRLGTSALDSTAVLAY